MVLFHNIISITIWELADRTLQYLYRSETWLHIKLCLNHSDNDMVGICVSGSFIKMAQFLGENWAHYRVTLVCYWTARKSINVYTYNHKTSPGFCAELSHRQSIHIMVMGDLLVRSFCLQLMTYIPPYSLYFTWLPLPGSRKFFSGRGGGGKRECAFVFQGITVCRGGGHDRSMHLLTLMVPIIIIIGMLNTVIFSHVIHTQ